MQTIRGRIYSIANISPAPNPDYQELTLDFLATQTETTKAILQSMCDEREVRLVIDDDQSLLKLVSVMRFELCLLLESTERETRLHPKTALEALDRVVESWEKAERFCGFTDRPHHPEIKSCADTLARSYQRRCERSEDE